MIGGSADQDLPRPGGLLQSRRNVDGVAGGERALGLVGDHDFPGVDAGADPDPHPVRRFELRIQLIESVAHLGCGAHGTQRVVLAEPWDAEDGHDGITDELLHGAAMTFDHLPHRVEVSGEHDLESFRIEAFAELGGADDVGEQDRYGPASTRRHVIGQWGSARRAEREVVLRLPTAAPARSHGVNLPLARQQLVGEGGVEPPRPFGHRNLNPARLPIPPLARVGWEW